MPTFRYKAYNMAGGVVSGVIEADSERNATVDLKGRKLLLREICEEGGSSDRYARFSFKRSISTADLALLTRRLATLLASSVPLFEAIGSLHEQEENSQLKKILSKLSERIAEGAALSRAMAAEPKVFSESYVSMVTAGEAGGALELVLERLADFLEEQEQVRNKVTSALAYPILMLLVGGGVMIFLLTVVIPKIVVIFEDSKAALPFITVALIKISGFLRGWWWLLVILIVSATMFYRFAIRRPAMRMKRDVLLLKIPVFGGMLQHLILSRFAKILGLLLSSGVPIIRALEITSEVLVNRVYRASIQNAIDEIAQGGTLSASLKSSRLFPPMLVHLVGVGEKGGTLEAMLIRAGIAFEREFSSRLARLMGLMEPILVLGMGIAVGVVVMAVLLPIFEMNQLVK